MMIDTLCYKNCGLLLVDLQTGFDEQAYWGGNRNNDLAEQVCFKLLTCWREKQLPIFHIRHASTSPNSPLHPNHAGFAFKQLTAPLDGECVITKEMNSAFIGTPLQLKLTQKGIDTLVIAGLTTDHCVSTTTRMAGNLGYKAFVVADGCATFDKVAFDGTPFDAEVLHQTALASLHGEFAQVISSQYLFDRKLS